MRFDAVVIGGSHGSFEVLLDALPQWAAIPFPPLLLALHIPRGSAQDFIRHFREHCGCHAVEAEDKQRLEARTIYLAPGGYHVLIERDQTLSLSSDGPVNHAQPSIDVLFESAAIAFGNRLLGVLLTGASGDGARGMAQIQALGGTLVVQTPASSVAPTMPEAALARCRPDHLVAADALGQLVAQLAGGAID
ncbi:MAG: chemotaxis protein CheB [Pseudomonadota bacterium]|nr:chemotaxis protein CheB [Pseudomonadota bacterium]